MEGTKEKVNLRRLVITIVLILITAIVVGGLVWFLMDKNTKNIISENNKLVASLEKQKKESKAIFSPSTTPSTTSATANDFTPVVVFSPAGLFTDTEKTEIKTKITNAYLAYHNENGLDTIAILVNKYQENERPQGYWYGIDAISKTGVNEGWLAGPNGTISYWMPGCIADCPFSDKFKKEYPNNVPK